MELYDHIPPIEEIRDIEMDVTENVIENVTDIIPMIATDETKISTLSHPYQNNHSRFATYHQGSPSRRIHSYGG